MSKFCATVTYTNEATGVMMKLELEEALALLPMALQEAALLSVMYGEPVIPSEPKLSDDGTVMTAR